MSSGTRTTRRSAAAVRENLQQQGVEARNAAKEGLADKDQLDKIEARARNKCRKLICDHDWDETLGICKELMDTRRTLHDLVKSGEVKTLTKAQLQEKLEQIDDDLAAAIEKQHAAQEDGPVQQGRESRADKELAVREANARSQADCKGMTDAEKEAHVAAAVARELEKRTAAQLAKDKEAQDALAAANEAVRTEREEKERLAREKAAEEARTRAEKRAREEELAELKKQIADRSNAQSKAPSEAGDGPEQQGGAAAGKPKSGGTKRKVKADFTEEEWEAEKAAKAQRKQEREEAKEAEAEAKREEMRQELGKERDAELSKVKHLLGQAASSIRKHNQELREAEQAKEASDARAEVFKSRAAQLHALLKQAGDAVDQAAVARIIKSTSVKAATAAAASSAD